MKSLVGKIKKSIFQSKGEILMEAIVSVLLLSILLVIVTTMIQTSRQMTASSMSDANELQVEQLNLATLDSEDLAVETVTITFQFVDLSAGIDIDASHDIRILDPTGFDPPSNIVAFFPDP
jgi:uncharacterized protein (UPF0333 family)